MLRSAIWLLLAFAGAVVLALLLRGNTGSVSIFWPPYRIDLSSNMVFVLGVIGFFLLHLLLLAISRIIGLPQRLRAYHEKRRVRRANRALQGAALAWFEGRFDKAEKLASAATAEITTSPAAALIAARSAHRLGAGDRRDDWLRLANEANPGQSATLLAEAEFALDDRRPERALAAVDRLRAAGVEPRLALTTSLATWRQFGRWEQVLEAVRAQKGRSARLEPVEIDALRLQAYEGLLAPHLGDRDAILECWRSLRNDERRRRDLAVPTVLALLRNGDADEARKILIPVLDREYDDTLVECYGALESIPARARLEQLERWRQRYGDRPRLLEMLGRVCASERLWGKAETYLLQAVAADDSVSARVALAQLYDTIDRRGDASAQFQAAARLALGERPGLALQFDPVRAQAKAAIPAARPATVPRHGTAAITTLPAAAAAASSALAHDDDTELGASLPHPVPAPEDAARGPVSSSPVARLIKSELAGGSGAASAAAAPPAAIEAAGQAPDEAAAGQAAAGTGGESPVAESQSAAEVDGRDDALSTPAQAEPPKPQAPAQAKSSAASPAPGTPAAARPRPSTSDDS